MDATGWTVLIAAVVAGILAVGKMVYDARAAATKAKTEKEEKEAALKRQDDREKKALEREEAKERRAEQRADAIAREVREVKETAKAGAKQLANEVQEVKVTLHDTTAQTGVKLDSIATIGEATHKLVNSAMGAQLKLHADTARAKADITHDPADIAVAELAERMLAEHTGKQAAVDAEQMPAKKSKEAP